MRKDKTYNLLVTRMHEIAAIPPQNLGALTFLYKRLVPHLKYSPWKSAAIVSFIGASILYIMLGASLIRLTSILQFGF